MAGDTAKLCAGHCRLLSCGVCVCVCVRACVRAWGAVAPAQLRATTTASSKSMRRTVFCRTLGPGGRTTLRMAWLEYGEDPTHTTPGPLALKHTLPRRLPLYNTGMNPWDGSGAVYLRCVPAVHVARGLGCAGRGREGPVLCLDHTPLLQVRWARHRPRLESRWRAWVPWQGSQCRGVSRCVDS
jgi:hypothetical protein